MPPEMVEALEVMSSDVGDATDEGNATSEPRDSTSVWAMQPQEIENLKQARDVRTYQSSSVVATTPHSPA